MPLKSEHKQDRVGGPGAQDGTDVLFRLVHGQYENSGRRLAPFYVVDGLRAVDVRHGDVHQDQVRI